MTCLLGGAGSGPGHDEAVCDGCFGGWVVPCVGRVGASGWLWCGASLFQHALIPHPPTCSPFLLAHSLSPRSLRPPPPRLITHSTHSPHSSTPNLRREQLRKEGKLLTGKAKAEAERLAAMRAQLLKQAEEKGERGAGGPKGSHICHDTDTVLGVAHEQAGE